MNWQSVSFDWNQVRAFLATVEEGSLSAAARALGSTQPTVGRQVAALEDDLGVTLFARAGRSLALTAAGAELVEHVRAMGDAAARISLAASGKSQAVEGQVSISASDAMSAYILPAVLRRLRRIAPGIEIEVVASNSLSDLHRREADIAVRHVRPEQGDLIARLVRESSAHLYAAKSYLDAQGRPSTPAEASALDFVGYSQIDRLIGVLNGMGLTLDKSRFRVQSDNGVAGWEMIRQGLGVGVMIREIADLTPEVERVLPGLDPIPVPVWLVTHREIQTSARIRIVFDHLAAELSRGRAGGQPPSRAAP